jgi:tRNA-binding protein
MENNLTWQEFERGINARGHHRGSQRFSEARKPAYQLTIDFGETIGLENFGKITKRYSRLICSNARLLPS